MDKAVAIQWLEEFVDELKEDKREKIEGVFIHISSFYKDSRMEVIWKNKRRGD